MPHRLTYAGRYNITHFVEAFRHVDSPLSEDDVLEPEVRDIIQKIRYFREKYAQKIANILDMASVLQYVVERHPDRMNDIHTLTGMCDRILEGIENRVPPASWWHAGLIVDRFQEQTMEELRENNKLLRAILNSTSQWAWFIDRDFKLRYVNEALCQMFGYTELELQGRMLFDFFDQPDREVLISRASLMDVQEHRDYILDLARKDGTYLPVKIQATTIRVDGAIVWAVAFLTDISEFRNKEKKLQKKANTDALTGLHNRWFFDQKLEDALEKLNDNKIQYVSLALIDADYFKKINDTYGHAVGDRVLKIIWELLLSLDIPGVSVFRYGGEEFALLGKNIDMEDMFTVAEYIRKKIQEMTVAHRDWFFQLTVSIGLETYVYIPENTYAAKTLTRAADERLYAAKAAGRNRVVSALNDESGTK